MLVEVENNFFVIWFLDKVGNAYIQKDSKQLFNFTRTRSENR